MSRSLLSCRHPGIGPVVEVVVSLDLTGTWALRNGASATAFPPRPRLVRRLDDHATEPILQLVATELRWPVR